MAERTHRRANPVFAVAVSVVRIGDSAPAPMLDLVVRPNDWGKQVRASTITTSAVLYGVDLSRRCLCSELYLGDQDADLNTTRFTAEAHRADLEAAYGNALT